jgi:hypothetical protein
MRRRIGNSKQNKEIDKEIDNNDKCQQVYKFLKVYSLKIKGMGFIREVL